MENNTDKSEVKEPTNPWGSLGWQLEQQAHTLWRLEEEIYLLYRFMQVLEDRKTVELNDMGYTSEIIEKRMARLQNDRLKHTL